MIESVWNMCWYMNFEVRDVEKQICLLLKWSTGCSMHLSLPEDFQQMWTLWFVGENIDNQEMLPWSYGGATIQVGLWLKPWVQLWEWYKMGERGERSEDKEVDLFDKRVRRANRRSSFAVSAKLTWYWCLLLNSAPTALLIQFMNVVWGVHQIQG